mgnify:CR=1 FL=1
MDKIYNHKIYEERIYSLWEKSSSFTPKITKNKKPFSIIMPPPNANENLHIGHARFITIEDILTRYHRMKGQPTLWLPGADHAGIETQYVFEKKLKEQGKSRNDFDRETLYKMIWNYSMEKKKIMESQLRVLGASCDWSRNKFTLDPDIIEIVYKTFKKLYDDGLVYRGERIVNYCPHCGTSFSQLEITYIERDDELYYIDYGTLFVATTRPETIFADVAVAVNPKDKRYKKIVGKFAILPIVNRQLPIIADALVDPEFGTGALKITPGHDPIDHEVGMKHSLSAISVVDEAGKMINTPPKYIGMPTEEARYEVVRDLEKIGKIKKVEKIHHTVGTCYKHKTPIEPILRKQWFIKVNSLAKRAFSAIHDQKVKIVSPKFKKIAKHWLKNLKDWNISRQIVWGIRIPAWRCDKCMEWVITEGKKPLECTKCKHTKLTQDIDTFDTWFSSGQWPYATLLSQGKISSLQFPITNKQRKKFKDFDFFYPTSVMETGYDILPFWVIRMIMLGIYTTGEVPFHEVVLHGLVRDAKGEKISKSKGNVIDPIEMTQKYGADAVRMGLVWGTLIENDIALSEANIKGQRNFANKIWNIARFILLSAKKVRKPIPFYPERTKGKLSSEDKDILNKLKKTIRLTNKFLERYRLSEAAELIYKFIWKELADKYLEYVKKDKNNIVSLSVLRHVFFNSLKILHPFMPFVTEVVWLELKEIRKNPNQLLIYTPWPKEN